MRRISALFATVTLVGLVTVAAQDKTPPEKIVFPTRQGAVTFLHAKHIERQNGECSSCHDGLWKQIGDPLKNSQGCHTCHKTDGKAFNANDRANCVRCHPADSDKTPKPQQ